MKMHPFSLALGALLSLTAPLAPASETTRSTTAGPIAIANLDHLIARQGGDAAVVDLLLERARFLGDHDALQRATVLAEAHSTTAADLLRRAQARAAVHHFTSAFADLTAAEHMGADAETVANARAAIQIATGHAREAVESLQARTAAHPGYASYAMLAAAYAELGRYEEADGLYARAEAELNTTSPFPHAWLSFARGLMWSEQAGDVERGEIFYMQALHYLPQFATADIHMAEIEYARGDHVVAAARLRRVLAITPEPEALGLLGDILVGTGEQEQGHRAIAAARAGYEALLRDQPLAYADHAAEFYLGPGEDYARAWQLARQNLDNRPTPRAYELAIDAARASGNADMACELLARGRARYGREALPANGGCGM